jgi:AraC-like DNA-binding protein
MKELLLEDTDEKEIKDELQWMENVISSMKDMIEDKKLAFKNNSINKLVQKKYSSLDAFVIEMNQSGYYPPYELFGFIIFQFENKQVKNRILRVLASTEYEELKLIQKDNMQTLQVFYLYNTSLHGDSLQTFLSSLFNRLKEDSPENMTMSVGRPGSDIHAVTDSLTEAITALEYRFVVGKNNVIFFSDIQESKEFERPISASELDLINISIYSGDISKISETLNHIIRTHNIHNLSLINAKALTYQISNRVMRTIDEILTRKDFPLSLSSEIQQKIYLSSIDEMVESIIVMIKELEYVLFSSGPGRNRKILHNALEIIDSNFMDPELSVQKIASDLKVSQSYLSRIYKKEHEDTILSYITGRRINLARKLLVETDLPIKLITTEVGYLDLSSFTRKFRQLTGLTPGNYRKRYSESGSR